MARIKIDLPEHFIFKCEIPIRISDINYGNHLGNDAVLSIMHEARLQFLKSINCTELDLFGASLIQSDAAIIYKAEAHYGDILICEIAVDDITRVSFDLYYRLINKATQQEVAIAKTGMVCYDYNIKKVVSVPEGFVKSVKLNS
ncbi:MAG: thioesterase family protein [Ignavibacteria bacterium]|nr:thioesterase family protein [Ignavibacteria bacterium]